MRAWVLKSRPKGMPQRSDFDLVDQPDQPLEEGQIRVRNLWLSVDPYMRGRMNDAKSYVPPFALGEPMTGGAVGEVIESRNPGFSLGDKELHMAGWRDTAAIGAEAMPQKLPDLGVSDDTWLHNLGLTGGTAYFGLLRTAEAKAGDIVFVSAAAGAVGSAVVQIAKLKGMTVIGSAGGPDKVAFVKELGADACIDYKAGPVLPQLAAAAPDGIHGYFDCVGGPELEAAIDNARPRARIVMCGTVSNYDTQSGPVPRNLFDIVAKELSVQGYLTRSYAERLPTVQAEMAKFVRDGRLRDRVTIVKGIESVPRAFVNLFRGEHIGKLLIQL